MKKNTKTSILKEDRVNEPEDRHSAPLKDVADINEKDLKKKSRKIANKNKLEEHMDWVFENPAEALFIGFSSVMSGSNPMVKNRVFDFVKLPPQQRLEKLFGHKILNYVDSKTSKSHKIS